MPTARGPQLLVRTTSERWGVGTGPDAFGNGRRVYNVIDVRQSYPQKVVKEAVRVLGHPEAADNSIHFAYEMVALTPAAVRLIEERTGTSFGLDADDMSKAYVEMSGRRGIGVKADEFLDVLMDAAEDAIVGRLGGSGSAGRRGRPRPGHRGRRPALSDGPPEPQPGPGLRLRRGPRIRGRHRSLPPVLGGAGARRSSPSSTNAAARAGSSAEEIAELAGVEIDDDLWDLVLQMARRREIVAQAVANLEFSLLAQHAHELAQLFHRLYHAPPRRPRRGSEQAPAATRGLHPLQ